MSEFYWYKVVDSETHEVLVAFGDDVEWFRSMGYTLYGELEQAYNGNWYEAGYAPKNPPLPELEAYKEQRKIELNAIHEATEKQAHVLSSLGFEIDANDRANRDVTGLLVTTAEDETVVFMDYSNQPHEITRADLEVMQREIIENAQYLYTQKWGFRSRIDECLNSEELSLLNFQFFNKSFYTQA